MNTNFKTLMTTTVMLLATVWGASNAVAEEPVRSERVKFSDLNVDTAEGVQALYGRIHAAAKRVCIESDSVMWGTEGVCARKAESDAIGKLNLAQLTAYYQSKTKGGSHTQPLVASR